MITAAVINFSMCHPEEPAKISDFVPGVEDDKTVDLTTLSPEQQAAAVTNQLTKKTFRRK